MGGGAARTAKPLFTGSGAVKGAPLPSCPWQSFKDEVEERLQEEKEDTERRVLKFKERIEYCEEKMAQLQAKARHVRALPTPRTLMPSLVLC